MSTSLLIQCIPDFEESTIAFPLKSLCYFPLFFPWFYFQFQSWHHWRCTAVLQDRRLQDGLVGYWQHDGRLLSVCAIAWDCFFWAASPSPKQLWEGAASWLLCHREALPLLSTTGVMCSSQRPEAPCSRVFGHWQAAWRPVCPLAVG